MSWSDNFTADASLNSSRFPIRWGDAGEFSFGSNGVTLTSDGNASGFLTPDQGASQSFGYGVYSATFTMPTNQANGAYILLWPATNVWPGPEIDLTEQLSGRPYLTVHWKGSDGSNQYQSTFFNANTSQPTTVAVDWEASSLTFYVNGQQVVRYQAGGPVPIPKDFADGGQNEAFGPGNVGPAGTKVTISNMSYSPSSGGSGGGSPSGGGSTGGGSTGGGSPGSGSSGGGTTTPIAISNPGTIAGPAPASETITFTDAGLANSTIYAVVMNPSNQFEENWLPVTLNNSGVGTLNMTFKESGDYVIATSNQTTVANKGVSSTVTIGPASGGGSTGGGSTGGGSTSSPGGSTSGGGTTTPIAISNPGTIPGPAPTSETITFTDAGLANSTIYAVVMNPSNQFEEGWLPVTLNNSGVGTLSMIFKETGDYVLAASNQTTEANKGVSSTVTIGSASSGGSGSGSPSGGGATGGGTTTPSTTIAVSSPGTQFVSNPSAGATVPITISDPGLSEVYAFVMTSKNVAEENWIPIPLNAQGQATYNFHFQNTGDYVLAVNNPSAQLDRGISSPITILHS
jgi:hypothetical protein